MRNERGVVAILLLLIIAMAAVTAITADLWVGETTAYQKQITQSSLQQAKTALLAYVEVGLGSTNSLQPSVFAQTTNGRLPCTDQNGDGVTSTTVYLELPCGSNQLTGGVGFHSLGLFPWATLGIPMQQDAYHQCLWYAVDGLFKINKNANTLTTPIPVNSDSPGSFSIFQPIKYVSTSGAVTWSENFVAGNPINPTTGLVTPNPLTQVVAVIISPGAVGGTQTQSPYTGSSSALPPCPLTTQGVNTGAGIPSAEQSAPNYLKNYTGPTTGFVANNNNIVYNQTSTPLVANLGSTTSTAAYKYFVTADNNQEQLNDQFVWITAEEFSKAATKGIARYYANAINYFVKTYNYYPPAAATAGGVCQTAPLLLQGYIPYYCNGHQIFLGSGTSSITYNTTSGKPQDPDWWSGLAHYAVSQNCTYGAGQTTSSCNGIKRIVLATSTSAVAPKAIILMRGRALPATTTSTEICPSTSTNGVNATPDISQCLEDTTGTNQNTVHKAVTTSLGSPITDITTVKYVQPSPAISNDYMIQLTQ